MLNAVEEEKRTAANSIANLCYNLLGYLPAPSFYGFISSIVDNPESTVPFGCLMWTTLITIGFGYFGVQYKIAQDR